MNRTALILMISLLSLPAQEVKRERPPKGPQDLPPAVERSIAVPEANAGSNPGSGRTGGAFRRFAVVLDQPPVAAVVKDRNEVRSAVGQAVARAVADSQAPVRAAIAQRGLKEIGVLDTLANAVFVIATPADAEALSKLSGVRYVQEMRPVRMAMTKALDVVRAPRAWNALGGRANAGAGVKVAILDSGIDHQHPVFQDSSLTMPAGFPKCSGDECRFTSNKIIAARSFVDRLIYFYPNDTRPDDNSPRDRVGHGTAAAMVAAGSVAMGPLGQTSGVAPKAYLGNYKIFGSPGVNDRLTFDDVIGAGLEAAFLDGMDIASLSLGGSAIWGPNDRGNICNRTGNRPCDLRVDVVEAAVRSGMTVVVSAGNDGDAGLEVPTLNSIGSPGTAPSAITVGASVNAHILYQSLRVENGSQNLRRINAYFGNGPKPQSPLRAPARDVSTLGDDGKACSPLSNGSLNGTIALILRGDCTFSTKVNHAQRAGAVGVVLYQATGNFIQPLPLLENTAIPLVLIGNTAGVALKQHLASNRDAPVVMDPSIVTVDEPAGIIAPFSSQGPSIGENAIKPELVAVGIDLLLATQSYDPNGAMFDVSGYTRSQGTSFSAPMVAGAAALVKQRNPRYTPAQIKSALVNAADPAITDYDYDGNEIDAYQSGAGAGQLDVEKAVAANITAEPATLSFGVIANVPQTKTLRIVNTSNAGVNLRFSVRERVSSNQTRITVTPATAVVNPGQVATLTVRLEGSVPTSSNWYEGSILIEGGATTLRVPYAFLVGNNAPFNAFPLSSDFIAVPGGRTPRLVAKFIDKQGVPVRDLAVQFRVESGGGRITDALARTDALGIADAGAVVGQTIGSQTFSVEGGGLRVSFAGRVIPQPVIRSGGVVNAASGEVGSGLAPGSYISIFGAALAEATNVYKTTYLPLSLSNISVGFDIPGRNLSYPARIHFISPAQINVQIPWELAGQATALLKVSVGEFSTERYQVTVNDFSPAAFEFTDPGSGRLLAAALDQNFGVVTVANPVRRGQVVQLFANGMGPVVNPPASGEPASTQTLSSCRANPEVTIGGVNAPVQFCGLAPGFVGLYQVNVTVPNGAATGLQPVVMRSGGVTSKTATLPVQ